MKPAAKYCNFERSVAAPVILPDEQLEHWGEVYLALPALAARGVSFEAFLAAMPQVRNVPRLLVQLALRARIDRLGDEDHFRDTTNMVRVRAAIDAAERAPGHGENGRLVVKLRHHAHPRSNHRDFLPEVVD